MNIKKRECEENIFGKSMGYILFIFDQQMISRLNQLGKTAFCISMISNHNFVFLPISLIMIILN